MTSNFIYFDNSATTKPYKEVVDSFVKVSTDYFGNPSSLHRIGGEAEKLLSKGRKQIAEQLAVKPSEIIFTSGGTESNNLAVKGAALMHRNRGNHIITSAVEHASIKEPYKQLQELGFEVTILPVDDEGRVSVRELANAISDQTILVSVMHVNNEVGTIQPIEQIGALLTSYPKVLFHVDHIQGVGKVPLNLQKSHVDLCSFSGHKFHGLKGTGLLYVREGVTLSPLLTGGSQERKYRSGTENVAGAVALAKALRLTLENMDEQVPRILKLKETIIRGIQDIEEIVVHTPAVNSAPHIINFSVKGFKAEVFVHALEEKDIYVSTTSACSSKKKAGSSTLTAMGVPEEIAGSAIRISLSHENTIEEANFVVDAIKETVNKLREVMK
ncbi:cysteine desulfurase family protein [Robertmurraya andreesenii]|uniref:Cysteine desulfurase n=1 Tax=Anoxybacillus andreesenii TaxID=1325932 RepID=A0ABT9V6C2_9BACL|nr:cysteine desulfurase family protein [Robertmurraya andreesenii]MDQ0156504.1 cysteine desulfurase [Robertmurraya andreesenii]